MIYLFGINHNSAPVEVREKVAIDETSIGLAYEQLSLLAEESVIISTCNRTEIYFTFKHDIVDFKLIKDWLFTFKQIILPDNYFFYKQGKAASQHLFQVASGIASQIIGDIQILGQVKDSLQAAQTHGSAGKILIRLFTEAIKTGKRVRTETEIFMGAVSVSYVAVELAKKIFYPLNDKSALVVGAGDAGELAVENLASQGVKNISITNRTIEKAVELSSKIPDSKVIHFENFRNILHEFDIIIVSTGAQSYVINYSDVAASAEKRGSREQLIVDISVPRNVEPKSAEIPNVYCKDLNDLSSIIDKNIQKRKAELPKANSIITDELIKFSAWCKMLPVIPFVEKIKNASNSILEEEFAKNYSKFVNENDLETAKKLASSIIKKIIGMPLAQMLDEEIAKELGEEN